MSVGNLSDHIVKTCHWFQFESKWLRKWVEFSELLTEGRKAKPKQSPITFY